MTADSLDAALDAATCYSRLCTCRTKGRVVTDDEFNADERIVRLRFLHEADTGTDRYGPVCPECSDPENGMHVMAPCLTIRTLDGEKTWMNTPDELSPFFQQVVE